MRLEKNTGKGRPMNIYSLAVPAGEIISYYEDKITKESQATILVIKKLKIMSKKVNLSTSK
jgi:predicted transcriptional regulator